MLDNFSQESGNHMGDDNSEGSDDGILGWDDGKQRTVEAQAIDVSSTTTDVKVKGPPSLPRPLSGTFDIMPSRQYIGWPSPTYKAPIAATVSNVHQDGGKPSTSNVIKPKKTGGTPVFLVARGVGEGGRG
jgi:hypothetical protein